MQVIAELETPKYYYHVLELVDGSLLHTAHVPTLDLQLTVFAGGSVYRLIKKYGPLPEDIVAPFVRQSLSASASASAFAFAHAHAHAHAACMR